LKKNEIYLKVRKYIDIATIVVTSILVITWVEVFNLSFLFIVYFLISLGLISFLFYRIRKLEAKKVMAEETIKELKTEEKILENEIESLENAKK
jgi:cell division protein FtsB